MKRRCKCHAVQIGVVERGLHADSFELHRIGQYRTSMLEAVDRGSVVLHLWSQLMTTDTTDSIDATLRWLYPLPPARTCSISRYVAVRSNQRVGHARKLLDDCHELTP